MGNSLTTWVRAEQASSGHLSEMYALKHKTHQIKLVKEPEDTYFFNNMSERDRLAVFNIAQLFNKEVTGITVDELLKNESFKKKIQALAVFDSGNK